MAVEGILPKAAGRHVAEGVCSAPPGGGGSVTLLSAGRACLFHCSGLSVNTPLHCACANLAEPT
jgi:hypothetical protein